MATVAGSFRIPMTRERRFFQTMAFVMTAVIVCGFSLQLATGRSGFARSPVLVHAHAVVFMGWVVINLAQNVLAANGSLALHRRLGWIGAGWVAVMVVAGTAVTVFDVQVLHVPFFFRPLLFLVFNPLSVMTFAGLTYWAIVRRRDTGWHARLHYCGMSLLVGPAFGRLLPVPFMIPWAYEGIFAVIMMFPLAGVVADLRRTGTVHPAWWWGIATLVGSTALTEAITYSPVGTALYHVVTAGTPGATVAPLAFPPFPKL